MTVFRNDIPFQELPLNTTLQVKAYRVKLEKHITLFNIYRNPQTQLTLASLQALFDELSLPSLILGDFNSKNPLWRGNDITVNGRVIEEFIAQNNVCIMNNGQPTHFHAQTATLSAIEISIASPELSIDMTWEVSDCFRGSDHFSITITVTMNNISPIQPKYIIDKADWSI